MKNSVLVAFVVLVSSTATAQVASGTFVGTGEEQSITGLGFKPVWVYVKNTNNGNHGHYKTSTIPGTGSLRTSDTNAALDPYPRPANIISLDDDGFTMGTAAESNTVNVVNDWFAFGPDSASTGTYTGDGTIRTIDVGFQPAAVIVQSLTPGAIAALYTASMPLNSTTSFGAAAMNPNMVRALTVNGFEVGTDARVNASGSAYHWIALRQNSAVRMDSYVGNSAAQRDITGVGFQPTLVIVKSALNRHGLFRAHFASPSLGNFFGNVAVLPTTNTDSGVKAFLPDGFTIQGPNNRTNLNAETYHYLAFGPGPTVTSIRTSPGAASTSSATFEFGSNAPTAIFECRLDGAASFTACDNPLTLTGLSDGPHVLEVRGSANGFVDATPAVHTWTADSSAPDTVFEEAPGSISPNEVVSFRFSATEQGATFECKVDTGIFMPCTSPHSFSVDELGEHNFQVRATDPGGNVDPSPASYTWTFDPTFGDESLVERGCGCQSDSGVALFGLLGLLAFGQLVRRPRRAR